MSKTSNYGVDVVPPPKTVLTLEEVLSKYSDLDLVEVGNDALKMMVAYINGDLSLSKDAFEGVKQLISKFLPSSGELNMEEKISPMEYLEAAIKENNSCFDELVQKARIVALESQERINILIRQAEDALGVVE